MKTYLLGTLFLLLAATTGMYGQPTQKTIEKIRETYAGTAEKARLALTDDEQGQFGSLFVNELSINSRDHQWRAVGNYSNNYKFYYRSLDTEDHMYPDQLVFIVNEQKMSDRSYREEWLFSDAGALVFYFRKSSDEPELRVYFSGTKPIRLIDGSKIRDRLNAADVKTVNKMLARSRELRQMFKLSINL